MHTLHLLHAYVEYQFDFCGLDFAVKEILVICSRAMIGTSPSEYVFARASIIFLHYVLPFGACCYAIASIIQPPKHPISLIIEIWAVLEVLFFLMVYLPRRYMLQRPAIHPADAPRQKRRELFDITHGVIEDHEQYLQIWFKNAPLSEIKRDNVKDFYCWAFLNKGAHGLLDDEELEEYVRKFEKDLGRQLEPGRGAAVPLRLTVDEVKMMHRPLVWYLVCTVSLSQPDHDQGYISLSVIWVCIDLSRGTGLRAGHRNQACDCNNP